MGSTWWELYKLNPNLTHKLERRPVSTLEPVKCENPVSSLCFFKFNLYRYNAAPRRDREREWEAATAAALAAAVGLYKLNTVYP